MTGAGWSVVLLIAAGVVVGWPARSSQVRCRALTGPGLPYPSSGPGRTVADQEGRAADGPRGVRTGQARAGSGGRHVGPVRSIGRPGPSGPPGRGDQRRPAVDAGRPGATGLLDRRPGPGDPGLRASWSALSGARRRPVVPQQLLASPRRSLIVAGALGAFVGGLVAGPVAAVATATYGALGVRAVLRWHAARDSDRIRRRRLDQLCALAADLRAGLPMPAAVGGLRDDRDEGLDRIKQLAHAAVRLADRTGAPLAELVERIEADARAMDRGLAAAAAQAAGARATAWLLAALPLGGIGLGYGIGVDPVDVLLHTPVGAGCAVAAIVLQVSGLLWAERLSTAPGRAG